MADRKPEGPKASFTREQATGGYIPKPPSDDELNIVSEAQGQITDEWTGEPSAQDTPVSKP
jgi:hypothetical protein